MVEINFAQPVFFDREETMNKFVDAIMNGINKRVRKGLWDIKEDKMADYEFNTTPAKVIQLEEIYGRLDRLEKLAHITCWRCLKEIPFNEAKIVVWPGDEDEIVLCSDCKGDYDLTESSEHYRYECALKDCLKEIRLQKK